MTTTPTPRTQLIARLLGVAAAAVLAIGLTIGLAPASTYGVTCGSAFAPSNEAGVADFADTLGGATLRTGQLGGVGAACEEALSGRRLVAVVVLIAGAGLGVAALAVRGQRARAEDPTKVS